MTMTDSADRVPEGKEALDLSAAANRLRLPIASVEKALERGFARQAVAVSAGGRRGDRSA